MSAGLPAPPPGFDTDDQFVVVEAPVFTMTRAWAHPGLSLAAVGLLARIACEEPTTFNLTDYTAGDTALATSINAELAAARILVDRRLVDPLAPPMGSLTPTFRPEARDPGTVYYVLRTDGAVKIGHTRGKLKTRLRAMARDYGALVVLATEAGPWALEQERHRQFGNLRMPDQGGAGGTEFFHCAPPLARHIENLRAMEAAA